MSGASENNQRKRLHNGVLAIIGIIGISLLVFYGSQKTVPGRSVRLQGCADLLHARIAGHTLGQSCDLVSKEYVSSDLEQQWLEHVRDWQGNYCDHVNSSREAVDTWLADIQRLRAGGAAHDGAPDPAVFSRFITTYSCSNSSSGGHTHRVRHTSWIEPLAFGLRHPRALCGAGWDMLMNRDYLLLSTRQDYERTRLSTPCVGRTCRSWYFDLGAGTYTVHRDAGGHQPSQQWFYDIYQKAGLEFDRMLLWEARVIPPEDLLSQLPGELQHKYQYFNVPVGVETEAPNHPLQILRQLVQEGDFVVLKLDLDNSKVETAFVQQLLNDNSLLHLVDDFFFEYHVNFQPMVNAGWGDTVDAEKSLADAYKLFLQLRKRGIRAHSWV